MNNKKYIYVNQYKSEIRERVEVSEEVYTEYWKYTEKEKYFKKCERKKISIEDIIVDCEFNLEEHIITKLMIDKLNIALSKLNDEEFKIITDIFLKSKTERELAKELNYCNVKLHNKKVKILKKLKDIIIKI